MTDQERVQIFAKLNAFGFLIEVLLADIISSAPNEAMREGFIKYLLSIAHQLDQVPTPSDPAAQALTSDIVVGMQEEIEARIAAAVQRAVPLK
jgi:hypothetical protein